MRERYHRTEGILYLFGHRVRRYRRLDRPVLLDVMPTLLALTGQPPAGDMPGRVLSEGLELDEALASGPRAVASYEVGTDAARLEPAADAGVDPQIVEHLRALGYLDTRSPKGDRNLAALHFEAGHYEEAAELYQALVEEDPGDGALRASLAGALGALGRLEESLTHLDKAIELQPANPEAYHNRGVIHERQGKTEAAVRQYQIALRYDPHYEPAQRALIRLRGTPVTDAPASPSQRLAMVLAEKAHRAAVRGDYGAAMRELDEAERIAPRYALVLHYRANVAHLMGDRDTAIAALRRALELEPDNPLYRTNLESLEGRVGHEAPVHRLE